MSWRFLVENCRGSNRLLGSLVLVLFSYVLARTVLNNREKFGKINKMLKYCVADRSILAPVPIPGCFATQQAYLIRQPVEDVDKSRQAHSKQLCSRDIFLCEYLLLFNPPAATQDVFLPDIYSTRPQAPESFFFFFFWYSAAPGDGIGLSPS